MKDGLTRSDRAFLKRTAMTGDHPWALRVWNYIQQHEDETRAKIEGAHVAREAWEHRASNLKAERDFVASERDRLMQAVEESRTEIARLREAAGALIQEWGNYIGWEDTEGHDDAVLVGEKIAVLRAALSRTGDDSPWGVQP